MFEVRHYILITCVVFFFAIVCDMRVRLRRVIKMASVELFCPKCFYELDAKKPPRNCPECGYEVELEKVRTDELRWLKRQAMIGLVLGNVALLPCALVIAVVRDLLTTFDPLTRMAIKPSFWPTALLYIVLVGVPWAWLLWFTGLARLYRIISDGRGQKSPSA